MMGRKFDYDYAAALIAAVLSKNVSSVEVLDAAVKTPELMDRPMSLDLLVMLDGQLVNVEIQLLYEKFYDLRCFMQLCALLQDRLHTMYQDMKGAGRKKIRHDTIYGQLPKVISINILGFYIDKEDPNYLWQFKFVDVKRLNRTAVSEIEIFFIELPKFRSLNADKGPAELKTQLDYWLYFFVMCDDKVKLENFLDNRERIFLEYENHIEEASKQMDFITRYENSIFFMLESMIMTPAEERDFYKEELEQTQQEMAAKLAAKDDEMAAKLAAKDDELAAKDDELATREQEIEILRKELEMALGKP